MTKQIRVAQRFLRSLGLYTNLALGRRKVGVLLIRGGFGNQLFQIAGLHYFSQLLNFIPIVCDLEKMAAAPQGRTKELDSIVSENQVLSRHLYCLSRLEVFFTRGLLRLLKSLKRLRVMHEEAFYSTKITSLPNLFFIQDYFQKPTYIQSFSKECLSTAKQLLVNETIPQELVHSKGLRCLIHIRLTDSHDRSDTFLSETTLRKIFQKLIRDRDVISIDCISDDLLGAQTLLKSIGLDRGIEFLENSRRFEALELLHLKSKYDFIISSRSTLCWWGCFLSSTNLERDTKIISFFREDLHLSSWLNPEAFLLE